MDFRSPWVLIFIPIVLALIVLLRDRNKPTTIIYSSRSLLRGVGPTWRMKYEKSVFWLRCMALVLFLLALSGPRKVLEESVTHTKGIDIVLDIDASGSMGAEDFKLGNTRYNRLHIVKEVVKDFIAMRPYDRLGLVTFGAYAYTVCPLTTDHNWLSDNLDRIELGLVEDGTAIGSAIATSVARLKDSKAKSKVVILLTDGMNNAGEIDPVVAAKIAKTYGIKIYTIGAGSKGYVPFPVQDPWGRKVYQQALIDLDENMLQGIAQATSGKYFRATDTESLKEIYQEIDRLEKVDIEHYGYKEYTEIFPSILMCGLLILVLEVLLNETVFLRIP